MLKYNYNIMVMYLLYCTVLYLLYCTVLYCTVLYCIVLTVLYCTAVAQWLRCCATYRKVAGSIPAGVIGIFH